MGFRMFSLQQSNCLFRPKQFEILLGEDEVAMWTKRGKACLILIFSTNTNCENMAYRSFRSEKYSASPMYE